MSANRPTRSSPPPLPGTEAPLDHALTLLLADETEAALRWAAAAVERDTSTPGALVVTSRLLERMGRLRAAVDGLRLAARSAIEARNLPLAVAALQDLRSYGVDVGLELDELASTFCHGSDRLLPGPAPQTADAPDFQPLSPFLAGPALASKAAVILQAATHAHESNLDERPLLSPLPLFSALPREVLRELLAAFEVLTVPAGHRIIEEGQAGDAAYVVARGALEISRRAAQVDAKPSIVMARVGSGAFIGESSLLSQLPAPATVTATRPSILLAVRRDALRALLAKHPELAAELAAQCRRHTVANLGWTSPVIAAMPAAERAALVERLETRTFQQGERLVTRGEEAGGLHLIVTGEVEVVAPDGGERVVLATLGPGETVGEAELVLCQKAASDIIALRGTATLFLAREEFFALVQEYPAILYGLYAVALRRHNETQLALRAGSAVVPDNAVDPQVVPALAPIPQRDPFPESARLSTATETARSPRRVTAPLPPPVETAAQVAMPAIPVARTIILQDEHRLPASSAPPSATSIPPTSTSVPPVRRTSARPTSPARRSQRAIGIAAVAAGVVAAAVVAARTSQLGTVAAAAAGGGEPSITTTAASLEPSLAQTAASPSSPSSHGTDASQLSRRAPVPSAPKHPTAGGSTPVGAPQAPSEATARVQAPAASAPRAPAMSTASARMPAAAATVAASAPDETKAAAAPSAAGNDEFGGRK